MRFEVRAPEGSSFGNSFAVSPDGRRLAFVAVDEKGVERLFVRGFDALTAQPLPGTEGARFPFWSPDGGAVAFFTEDRLLRVDVGGGPAQGICAAGTGRGGTWSPNGVIVFAPGSRAPLHRVSASGGVPVPLTKLAPGDYTHRWPKMLPDGKGFLFLALSDDSARGGVYAASLDTPEAASLVVPSRGRADFGSGRLLYVRDDTLLAQPFDPVSRKLSGEPRLVAEGIPPEGEAGWTGLVAASCSSEGTLVYRRRSRPRQQLTWLDRTGKPLGTVGEPAVVAEPFFFPGGQRVGVAVSDRRTDLSDIWSADLSRGTWSRLTFGPKSSTTGAASPDGAWLYFGSNREGRMNLYRLPLNGTGGDELLLKTPGEKFIDCVAPDGKSLVYESMNATGHFELWKLDLEGERKTAPVLAMKESSVSHAALSPDGKLVAYTSDETGRAEVYVQTFPPSGGKWQISAAGGDQALWRGDGRELFFVSPDRKLMAASIVTGRRLEPGTPGILFTLRIAQNGMFDFRSQYLPAPDGQRFLALLLTDERNDTPAVVVLNWPRLLAK